MENGLGSPVVGEQGRWSLETKVQEDCFCTWSDVALGNNAMKFDPRQRSGQLKDTVGLGHVRSLDTGLDTLVHQREE